MIRQSSYFRRLPSITVAQFQDHWQNRHAEVVTQLPGIVRYIQNHTTAALPGRTAPFDGIAEVWFESKDAMKANVGSDALRRIRTDEANFIDASSTGTIITDDFYLKEPGPAETKLMALVRRQPDLSLDEFTRKYRDEFGPLVANLAGIAGYLQGHCALGAYRDGREPPYDALATLWFADAEGMQATFGSSEMASISEIEQHILQLDKVDAILCQEVVII